MILRLARDYPYTFEEAVAFAQKSVPDFTAEEMEAIRREDRNCRLIKGQVFLWEGAGGWEDLWDVDGGRGTWKVTVQP